jgi:hypothetical protein
MARKESVLTEKEKDSFHIEKFIFHIITQEDVIPRYLDEVVLTDPQVVFFKERLKDISEGTQHIFQDKTNSTFYKDCEDILADPDQNFLKVSRKLTASFKALHDKNTNDGVFITVLAKIGTNRRLIFFLKVDHRKVYEYTVKDQKALLTEITQTFVEDKKAIQKAALVDISDEYSWDVLAFDRTASGKKALRDYFANFLSVIEKETATTLTAKVVKSVREWAIANKDLLGLENEVSHYKSRVIDYLASAAKFKTKECLEAVLRNDDLDENKKNERVKSLKGFFDEKGLSGQSFVPSKSRLDKAVKSNIRETAEGVKIIWEGEADDLNITIPGEKDVNDGLFHILIKTSKITIKDKD